MGHQKSILIAVWVLAVFGYGSHASAPIEPAPPNDFVAKLTMPRVDRGQKPIEIANNDLDVAENTGFVAQFAFEPQDSLPRQYLGRNVVPPVDGSMIVTVAPRDRQQSVDETVVTPAGPMHATHRFGAVHRSGSTGLSTDCGMTVEDIPPGSRPMLTVGLFPKNPKLSFWSLILPAAWFEGQFTYRPARPNTSF